jgi:hypothetical protein
MPPKQSVTQSSRRKRQLEKEKLAAEKQAKAKAKAGGRKGRREKANGSPGQITAAKLAAHTLANKGPPGCIELHVQTLYEGPSGPGTTAMLTKKTLIITNHAIEIEIEGANAFLSVLTFGFWYLLFSSVSIEIIEV